MLTTDLRYEMTRTRFGETGELTPKVLRALYDGLEEEARLALAAWFEGEIETVRSADMRYGEQIHEIDVDLDQLDFADEAVVAALKRAFEARHETLYTYSLKDRDPVLVNAKVASIGRLEAPPAEPAATADHPAPPSGARPVYLDGWIEASVYPFADLQAGQTITGPAVIEAETTTVLLHPGDRATATEMGWLDIAIAD
jgi:N-methylhydantoinase A